MLTTMKIGLIREGKFPPDNRVVLTPTQARDAADGNPGLEIVAQPSALRAFLDKEYRDAGIPLQEDLGDCDILLGVKEVPVDQLLPGKTYFFFSHTIKKQAYNRHLLQEILRRDIRLIDYECLTDDHGIRVIAFGRWAGIVGAHNGLYTWGKRTSAYSLKRAHNCRDYAELVSQYPTVEFPAMKIATTGSGRVANGANELLRRAGIREVSPKELLENDFEEAVFSNLRCEHLYRRRSDGGFGLQHFFSHPGEYESIFEPYTRTVDLFINSIYWDPAAPAFFSLDDMEKNNFRIRTIADITCDIAPVSSIPSTIRPSSIEDPVYGFDPASRTETEPYLGDFIDIMAVDNLPNELPRDASESFGEQFLGHVLPALLEGRDNAFLGRGTIARDGDLTRPFEYLRDYVEGS
jgi:alanine dehydrogenase